jgi:Cytochrome c554 and c-prime
LPNREARTPPERPSAAQADAELAELYKSCPLAAVIDLQTVATSPEKVDAILPPYRELAEHVPDSQEPSVPRIRYPVHLGASNGTDELRVAQAPHIATNTAPAQGEWLIDPNEWLGSKEKPPSKLAPAEPSESGKPGEDSSTKSQSSETKSSPAADSSTEAQPQSEAAPSSPSPAAGTPHDSAPAAHDLPQPIFAPPGPAATASQPTEQLPAPAGSSTPSREAATTSAAKPPAVDPHLELFTKSAYPSARECAVCHEEIYQQWSVSAHAYAAVSPMFNKFEQRLNDLSRGTVGYFCMRCHAPVATSLCATRDQPLWTLPEAAREGITCVACHRVQYAYGKSNGERRIETGDINAPVFGGIGGDGVADAIAHKDQLKVKTSPDEKGPGQNIHIAGIYFQPLTRSEFCTPCHQVAVYPGIKLEVVWEQYRASPACKKGIQCQDCHMGRVPGVPAGYDCGPVAKVAGKTVNDNRKKSNHIFYGPNYPIAHPGVFPFNLKANRWTMDQWLTFDWRAGWGTKAFEDRIANKQVQVTFPPLWTEADDRMDAREIIDDNLKKLNLKRDLRVQVMENGSHIEGPIFDSSLCRGQDIDLHYIVTNTNDGHNLVTASLGAQPQLWANIVLIGPDGSRLWETGYTDSCGDVANIHSYDVRHKTIPYDWQLFNLQTMFLITGVKGTDREFYVPVNLDIDQLPFIRPGTQPISVLNHPPFIRMESQSLAALGSRRVPYRIPGELIKQPGTYRLSFRMRSRSEPIYFMRFCGATEEMERSMNEWMIDIHPSSVEFEVH